MSESRYHIVNFLISGELCVIPHQAWVCVFKVILSKSGCKVTEQLKLCVRYFDIIVTDFLKQLAHPDRGVEFGTSIAVCQVLRSVFEQNQDQWQDIFQFLDVLSLLVILYTLDCVEDVVEGFIRLHSLRPP